MGDQPEPVLDERPRHTIAVTPRSRPSLTARSIAGLRRRLPRPVLPSGDADAEDRLLASLRWAPAGLPGMATYVAERTRFFDDTLLDALRRGVRQVVIVGAGYDGRALRYRHPGVAYFEVDHPATQADKRERLRRLGTDTTDISFVPADFGRQSLADALDAGGQRADAPTHFLCEGVTPYLPRSDLAALVGDLARRAAPGSTLAVDFLDGGEQWPATSRVKLGLVRTGTAMLGERMVGLVSEADARGLFARTGWGQVAITTPAGSLPVLLALAGALAEG